MSKDKLIPEIRFSEFKNTEDWKVKTIDELCDILNNIRKPISSSDRKKGSYPYYGASGIIDYVDDFLFDERLLLIGEDGAKWGAYENTAFLVEGKYWVNNHAHVLKPKLINDKLLESYLVKLDLHPYITGAAPPKLTLGKLKEIPVPVPENEIEQRKIADCLSSLDEVIAAHSQKLELLKDHKKGLMQNLFPQEDDTSTGSARVPKYRFKEFQNDEAWVEKKLGEIAENLDSKRIPITSTQRDKGNIPYYGASGVVDYVKDHIFDETLLCISEDGANLIDRNYPIAFTISGKTWVNNHAHVLKFENLDTQILVEKYINAINIEDFLTGMAQPKLNRGNLDIIPIPLPKNSKEQQKIASCLSSLDALITAQAGKIEQLKLHKKGLMQGLFPKITE